MFDPAAQPIPAGYWHRRARHVASRKSRHPARGDREESRRLRMALPAAESQVSRGDTATAIAVLRQRFGERLQTGAEIRRQHANTITWIPNQPPDAVIWVESTDEVRQVVEVARTHGVPIVPFGAGTSLEGHINAPHGGLSLDFARMNRVLAVNERD